MLRAQGLTHVAAKISRHRVVVQQRIVDVEQEHDIFDRRHHPIPLSTSYPKQDDRG